MTYIIVFFVTYIPLIVIRYFSYGSVELSLALFMGAVCMALAYALGSVINSWRKFSKKCDERERLKKKILYQMAKKDISLYERQIDDDNRCMDIDDELKRLRQILADVSRR